MEKFHYNKITKESGFSLIEVVAALVILSIVTLALTAFFINSMDYAKGNQNKTVMVNLARNALVYMEKQPFEKIKDYFTEGNDKITCDLIGDVTVDCSAIDNLVNDSNALSGVFYPKINGVRYEVTILYQEGLHGEMEMDTNKKKMSKLLLPVLVKVTRYGDSETSKRSKAEVEGYITSEKIR